MPANGGSVVPAQYPSWSRTTDGTRNGFRAASHLLSTTCRNSNPSFITKRLSEEKFGDKSQSSARSLPCEHSLESRPSPRRPPAFPLVLGTFEYGYTYGSSSYRHDQATFLGTPRLHTRYQPDYPIYRHVNRSLQETRRRQFSPFMPFQRYTDKSSKEQHYDGRSYNCKEKHRTREFPVNHDWDDAETHKRLAHSVYSAGALIIWKEDGYCGFLCDKNTLYGNLHFYADCDTIIEEDDKPLEGLCAERLKRGQRVEIEAEFSEPDLADPDVHHLVHVDKILKIGGEASLERVCQEVLVPLTKKKSSSYFKALCETGDLVYIHPSIFLSQTLLEFMKQHAIRCRPQYVEDALSVLCSNRCIRGEVAVAPSHAIIKPYNSNELVYYSLISAPLEFKSPLKVGGQVRYTACLDLPNSTYKWRCLGVARISRVDLGEEVKEESTSIGNIPTSKPALTGGEIFKPANEVSENICDEVKTDTVKAEENMNEILIKIDSNDEKREKPRICSLLHMLRTPPETFDTVPVCLNETPRKVFSYGDEAPCHFTIRDELERSQYANFSALYKSMEDFLLRHARRRYKHKRRHFNDGISKGGINESENKGKSANNPARISAISNDLEPSVGRFNFVGVGDDISQMVAAQKQREQLTSKAPKVPQRSGKGWWYRRTTPRIYPTVVVAEFIKNRDKEKDCNENINVHKLTKTIIICNAGEFEDEDEFSISSKKDLQANHTLFETKDKEPNIMTLLQNDQIMGNFFGPLLKNLKK
ncbi:unnamed protein product [Cylicocyclus nassatus]|uniref:Uncharacterized protein n=1 Tax=Cylicocyclus nassatus TaxID=53992 RepID=A0AA36MBV7_CYLNA|nr:unnamed protein product [Cylicocyclus nassatus]